MELDALPIEVDPLDWADQQQLTPLPEDDYPRVEELEWGDELNHHALVSS